jgi:hypothetical protein
LGIGQCLKHTYRQQAADSRRQTGDRREETADSRVSTDSTILVRMNFLIFASICNLATMKMMASNNNGVRE